MVREEKKYIVTEIKKCDKNIKEDKTNIILSTIFAIISTMGISISSNLILVRILGILILSGSLFTLGYSIYEKGKLKEQREKLVNKIKFDKLESSYHEDLDIDIDKPSHIYYK